MFAVFRSLHMKLMLILLLLITSLMAVVGAFLTTSVSSFYIDTFYEQISAVFSDDSDGYVSTLRARAAEPDGAAGIKEMLEGRAGSLGIDYRTRNYFILDGQSGTYLDGSAEASELPREQTANLLTARNAVAQGDSTLVGDRSDITADYMDAAIPIMGGGNAYIIYILDNKDTVTDLNSQLFLIIMQALVIGLLISVLLSFLLSKPMGAYQLGEGCARSMGVNIRAFRTALILLSSVLSASVTAFAGPISFVGIAVPHITRLIFRTSRPMVLIPATFLTGSVFCLACDLIARTAFSPTELTISTVTSVLGAPVVIWLMIKRRRNG